MSFLSELFKPLTKNLQKFERVMNSAQTPEEFILEKKMAPSIARIKTFLQNYSIHQTFKAKVYNSDSKLYLQNNCISIILEINVTDVNDAIWSEILALEYPESTTLSFIYTRDANIFLTITTKDHIKKRNSYKLHTRMTKIAKHISDKLLTSGIEVNSVIPTQLLDLFNHILSQPMSVEYNPESYIYQQVPKIKNSISQDGYLNINRSRHYVIYTKQYPNILEDKSGIFSLINKSLNNNSKYLYSINIELSTKFGLDQILAFNTTFILQQSTQTKDESYFINLLRNKLEWIVFSNMNYPLQQLLNCIPLQYDHQIAQQQHNYSTNQKLPLTRIAQLIPSFGDNYENI